MLTQTMLTPDNCALALIDFQPAMFQGVQSHYRLVIKQFINPFTKKAVVWHRLPLTPWRV